MTNTESPARFDLRLSPRAAVRLAALVREIPNLHVENPRDSRFYVFCTLRVDGSPDEQRRALGWVRLEFDLGR